MKKIIFNHRVLFPISIAVFMSAVAFAPFFINEPDLIFTAVVIAIAILFFAYCAIQPLFYILDSDKLTIKYLFGFYEIIMWKNIKQVKKIPLDIRLFNLSVLHFTVEGGSVGKKSSFTNSEVILTPKTYRYIKQYYGDIDINILSS